MSAGGRSGVSVGVSVGVSARVEAGRPVNTHRLQESNAG